MLPTRWASRETKKRTRARFQRRTLPLTVRCRGLQAQRTQWTKDIDTGLLSKKLDVACQPRTMARHEGRSAYLL